MDNHTTNKSKVNDFEKFKVMLFHHTNWPVTVLLILGVITVAFPLYMTVVIAFKQPSEMTNSISGILSLPKSWSLTNFQGFGKSAGQSILSLLPLIPIVIRKS